MHAPQGRGAVSDRIAFRFANAQRQRYPMKTLLRFLLLITSIVICVRSRPTLQAATTAPHEAEPTGTISGRVSNAATQSNLEGAIVRLEGTSITTTTEREGLFRLQVPPGAYRLTATYTGLDPQTVPITVDSGAAVQRDLALTANIYRMSAFAVSGEREGNALAITLQRQSDGFRNIVSTDAFGPLAGNPMELLARMPGVEAESVGGELRQLRIRGMSNELNTVTMDGNRIADANIGGQLTGGSREVQFQGIGSDTFERVELIKSPTPDMDADSIGGAVNLISKNAFDRAGGRRVSGSIGFNTRRLSDERDSLHHTHSFSYSEIFAKKFGIAFNYSKRPTTSLYESTTFTHELLPNDVVGPAYTQAFQIKDNEQKRTRWGGGLRFDYKFSEHTRFHVNGTLQKHQEYGHSVNAIWSAPVANIMPGYTDYFTEWRNAANNALTLRTETRERHAKTVQVQFGASHQYDGWKIDYDAFRSKSSALSPPVPIAEFILRGYGARIEVIDDRAKPLITQTAGLPWTDLSSYVDNNYNYLVANQGIDEYVGGTLHVRRDLSLRLPTYVKAGLRYRRQTRDMSQNRENRKYIGPDGVVGRNPATGINDDNLAQFAMNGYDNLIFDRRYPTLPYPALPFRDNPGSAGRFPTGPSFSTALKNNPEYFREDIAFSTQDLLIGDRRAREEIPAAYVMGQVKLGPLSVLAGVRYEETRVEGEGSRNEITPEERARRAAWVGPLTNDEIIRRTRAQYGGRQTANGKYHGWFPGLHLKYTARPDLLFRFSYASNIGRPSFAELIPTTTVDYDNQTVRSSNPSLRPQYADNFDLGAEYYFEPVGTLSANVFYKEIRDFIFTRGGQLVGSGSDNGFNGEYAGFLLTTQANGGAAKLKGFELNYSQQFTFLPGWWSGFGAYANYTRVDIEGNYGDGGAIDLSPTDEIAGFKPVTANIGISYIRNRISARVKLNYTGRGLRTYNVNLSRRVYDRPRTVVDLNLSYSISKHFDIYLDVQNLFREADRARDYRYGRPQTYLWLDPLVFLGLNWRL
jgi:iron complex outermembrane recepter protein